MRRPQDTTEPGLPPDTDPGPEPEAAPPARDLYNPPIRDPEVAALLRSLNASTVARPQPKVVPTTDGELTAKWAGEAHEVQVAHPTPDLIPNVLLECTEERPIAVMAAVEPKAQGAAVSAHVKQSLIETVPPSTPSFEPARATARRAAPRLSQDLVDTDPGPGVPIGAQSRVVTSPSLRRSAQASSSTHGSVKDAGFPDEGVERAANRVAVGLPERRKRHLGLVVGAVLALVATIGVAALVGHGHNDPPQVPSMATPPSSPTTPVVVPTPSAEPVRAATPPPASAAPVPLATSAAQAPPAPPVRVQSVPRSPPQTPSKAAPPPVPIAPPPSTAKKLDMDQDPRAF